MEPVEFTAKTTEEALRAAQEHFGLSLDQLEVEVVSAGSGGLFGFLGSKKALIKARPRGKSQAEEVAELVAVVTEGNKTSLDLGGKAPAAKSQPAPKPQPPARAKDPGEARPQAEAEPPAQPPPPQAEDRPQSPDEPAPPRGRPEPEPVPEPAELLSFAREVLVRLAQALDPNAKVEAAMGEHGVELSINGGEPGMLIGRRGQTLDALQYLTTRIVSHKYGRAVHLTVDAGGYRQRRRSSLEEMARSLAEKARASRKTQSMGPMSAQERRVVHLALRSYKGISTVSRGKGELKKVVITPR
jgi:spoIIIJ-associated protein